ncbi:unnamed protein product [Bursaphelenchus xylophilus]|uniref:(pine wood nematode) hypothetical protein n=1 Tax=Bursaphelenchus xylophilus TaxID=6326 RepID=A0A1I7S037_BURXY|nr:unnamed protein product [Bursaphelenchus xylophilus]CAG9109042.1 unnamed protein product [Bursaphelenchus xylophilus]
MASRDLSDLSLDDIIKTNRTQKSGGARRTSGAGGSRPVRRVGGAGPIKKRNQGTKKWDNDKFFEVYANKKSGGGSGSAAGGKAVCRLANIPYNVTQEELETLFQKYRLSKVTLHYDYKGRSVGTAELHGNRDAIQRVKRDFTGVEIDGRAVEITVVGAGGGSPSLARRISRPGGGAPARRGGPGRGGAGGKGPKKTQKPKLTAAELDKELDEYMKSTNKMES